MVPHGIPAAFLKHSKAFIEAFIRLDPKPVGTNLVFHASKTYIPFASWVLPSHPFQINQASVYIFRLPANATQPIW